MVVAVMVTAALASCGKSGSAEDDSKARVAAEKQTLAPIIEKHRAIAGKKFEALQKVDAEAIAAPNVTTPEPIAEKLRSSQTRPSQMDLEQDGILIASPGWLAGPSSERVKLALWPTLVDGPKLKQLFAEGYWDTSGYATTAAVEGSLDRLSKVNHIIFVRTRAYTEPTVDDSTKSFTPPSAAGDVLVYSIPDGKRVAASPFEHTLARDKITTKLTGLEAVNLSFKTEVLRQVIDQVVE